MVIYDLQCENQHEFEGWFKNANELQDQQTSGLLICPVCDSAEIKKKVTAAKVGRKSNMSAAVEPRSQALATGPANHEPDTANASSSKQAAAPTYEQLQKMLNQVHKFVDSNFTDVGNKFADKALKIHRGEQEPENIRGTASQSELKELAEEGVSALPLPPKPVDKDKLN